MYGHSNFNYTPSYCSKLKLVTKIILSVYPLCCGHTMARFTVLLVFSPTILFGREMWLPLDELTSWKRKEETSVVDVVEYVKVL